MKKGLYQDLEKEWKKLKRFRFFYIVLPVFLTMLSVRIIQVYFHLKLERFKKAAASCRREAMGEARKDAENSPSGADAAQKAGSAPAASPAAKPVPEPIQAEKADMEFITPQPVAAASQEGSCTVTEEF